jgi:two-component system chemotaxis response regulator CheY
MSDSVKELLDENLIQELIGECRTHIDDVELDLLNLVDGRIAATPEAVNRVFRAFHSVKGALSYLGFDSLRKLAHLMESVIMPVRDGSMVPSSRIWDALFPGIDCLKAMTADAEANERIPMERERSGLIAILNGAGVRQAQPAEASRRRYRAKKPHGLRILIAEDEFTCRVLLQGMLSRYGECHVAVNGREAVDASREARRAGADYDLICMDIRMPEMDGRTAVEMIRAAELAEGIFSSASVRIFMTTCIHEMKSVVSCFQALCDVYLLKPVEGDKLDEHLLSCGLIV